MCDNYRNEDTADWNQYHPALRRMWEIQITAYKPQSIPEKNEGAYYKPRCPIQPMIDIYSQRTMVIEEGFNSWMPPQQQKAWK